MKRKIKEWRKKLLKLDVNKIEKRLEAIKKLQDFFKFNSLSDSDEEDRNENVDKQKYTSLLGLLPKKVTSDRFLKGVRKPINRVVDANYFLSTQGITTLIIC